MKSFNKDYNTSVFISIVATFLLIVTITSFFVWKNSTKSNTNSVMKSTTSNKVQSNINEPLPATNKTFSTTATTTSATVEPVILTPAPVGYRQVKSDVYKIAFNIPESWSDITDQYAVIYRSKDNAKNIEITLRINRNPDSRLSCAEVPKDSEQLTYDNPIGQQPKVSYVTISSFSTYSSSICGAMLTGNYRVHKGDRLPYDVNEISSYLPPYRVVAYISNLDSSTTYPTEEVFFSSPLYEELVATFKSIQVLD